ncbi:hypothetical protein TNCV_2001991 [Trichonephila clavipes]|nr:hypothetical protein TNCV_2001991 [Trichonephila clavipes]
MNKAAAEVHKYNFNEVVQCDVLVDGILQRRGHLSLYGCVSAIFIDTDKVFDIKIDVKMCRLCPKKPEDRILKECVKHVGSSGTVDV